MLDPSYDFKAFTSPMTLTLDFHGKIFSSHILGMGRSIDLEWKSWIQCWMYNGLPLGPQWQIDQFPTCWPIMGYSFTDLGAEGCCRSLNALFCLQTLNFVYLWISSPNFRGTLIVFVSVCRILVILNNVQLQFTHCLQLPTPTWQGYPSRP